MKRLTGGYMAGQMSDPIRRYTGTMPRLSDGFVLAPHDHAPGSEPNPVTESIDGLKREISRLADTRGEAQPGAKAADGGRYAAALDGSKEIADKLAAYDAWQADQAQAKAKVELRDQITEMLKEERAAMREPSKAAAIGDGGAAQGGSLMLQRLAVNESMKAMFGEGYVPGTLLSAIAGVKGTGAAGIDIDEIQASKAVLQRLGVIHALAPENAGKATLGTTGATGGYVLPNNLVDAVVKPATQRAIYGQLVRVIPGVNVRGVDQPFRDGAPTRMTYQNWGSTKENVNETYGSYTANLVTFARIYDIAKQYLRFSAGAAERDVLDELTKAAALAENYEVIAGPGTGSVGSGDACLGIYTALNATPSWYAVKGAKTGTASNSTVAGSFAAACAELMGLLAGRNRELEAIVVDSTTFFTALAQGSDNAGFWVDPAGGPTGFTRTASGGLAYFGTPIFYDTNLGTNAATKIAIGAEWSAFKLYRGSEFRIDTSDQAGDRWDKNLVGFRGEMEMGFNADTGVHVGAAQLMTSVIP